MTLILVTYVRFHFRKSFVVDFFAATKALNIYIVNCVLSKTIKLMK